MNVSDAKRKVINLASAQVGYCEGANNWNKYAADLDPLGITYGPKQNMPWCGEFVLWLFWESFGVDDALKMLCSPKPSGIPLCSAAAKYFKDAGRWSFTPEIGDVVFFYYAGGINHTGIVVNISGGILTTVEGNSGDEVRRNSYALSSAVIAGYGRPRWDVVSDADDIQTPSEDEGSDEESVTVQIGVSVLSRGDKGECVRAAQFLLNGRGCSCGVYGADGDFGPATEAAVLAFQRRNKIGDDGVIGPVTWAALLGVKT